MKVLHVISSLNRSSGGTSSCTYQLVEALNAIDCTTDILTLAPEKKEEQMVGNAPFVHALPFDACSPLNISMNIRKELKSGDYELFHANGLWEDVVHATCATARKRQIPYVLSLHGALYPQAMAISPVRKKVALALGYRKDIASAACLHATSIAEMEHIRAAGFRNPIAVIPNPVEIPQNLPSKKIPAGAPFRVGFLGRFHPIKNIDLLIKAWAAAGLKNAELLLYGDGAPAYISELQSLVNELQLTNVRFMGFVNGLEKYQALAKLDVLCAPSKQENFGMSIAEALLASTPVIASTDTPWQELHTHRCGWWIPATLTELTETLATVHALNRAELVEMGRRGQVLMMKKYSSSVVADMMQSLYSHILNNSEKPDFVYT